jgi:hypothetical protein
VNYKLEALNLQHLASRIQPGANVRRDLFEAMKQVAETGLRPQEQIPSMGCSIKWMH